MGIEPQTAAQARQQADIERIKSSLMRVNAYAELLISHCREIDDNSDIVYSDIAQVTYEAYTCILDLQEQRTQMVLSEKPDSNPSAPSALGNLGVTEFYLTFGYFNPDHIADDYVTLDGDFEDIYRRALKKHRMLFKKGMTIHASYAERKAAFFELLGDDPDTQLGVSAFFDKHNRFNPDHVEQGAVVLDEDIIIAYGNEPPRRIPVGTRIDNPTRSNIDLYHEYGETDSMGRQSKLP